MIKKLRIKFISINMTIVTVMICIIMAMMYFFTRADFENQSISMMKNIAVSPVKPDISLNDKEQVHLPYFTFKLGNNGEKITVCGGYYDLSNEKLLDDLVSITNMENKRTGVLKDYQLRYCVVDTNTGKYVVFADMTSELTTLHNLMKTSLIISIFAFIIFLVIFIYLSKWVVSPVEKAFKDQQQFIADASHELKTPLTVIMTNAQMINEISKGSSISGILAERILKVSNQMKNLVEEMLELARSENVNSREILSMVDLSNIVKNAALPFEALFFEKGLILEMDIEDNIKVKGDENSLRHLVEILIDNASKYSILGGETNVILKNHGKNHCLLEISNDGEPIEKEKLEHLFKRFYRTDESRNDNDSYGLGLAIAKNIVTKHKGKIWIESINGVNSCKVIL